MVTSSDYTPLDSLLDLACRDGVDIRPTLLRVLTDLYVQKPTHSADETAQYTELAVGLIGAADAATRAVVAARLAAYPRAPAAVLRKLAATTSAATRSNLPPLNTPRAVPRHLPKPDFGHDITELFFSAPAVERRLIVASLDIATEPRESPAFLSNNDLIRHLESAALRRNTAEFGHLLVRDLGLGHVTAERIACDSSGEATVVTAKAIGMTVDVLQRILLFLNPAIGHSVERVFGLTEFYHEITASAAGRMLAMWREAQSRSHSMHSPHYFDDETADARSRATPARQRAPYPRPTSTSRARLQG